MRRSLALALLLANLTTTSLVSPVSADSFTAPQVRVPTSNSNVDQICEALPGGSYPVAGGPLCTRQINKTTGAVTALPSFLTGVDNAAITHVYTGGAHQGTTVPGSGTWLEALVPGTIYPVITPQIGLSPPGGRMAAAFYGGQSATQVQDATGLFPVLNAFMWLDANPSHATGWVGYDEADVTDSANWVRVIAREISSFSVRPGALVTPFALNPQDHNTTFRIDCGKGAGTRWIAATGKFDTDPTHTVGTLAQPCSSAIEVVNNGAQYKSGIIFDQTSLATLSDGLSSAIGFGPLQALRFYTANSQIAWSVAYTGTGATIANTLQLGDTEALFPTIVTAASFRQTGFAAPASSTAACAAGQFGDDANYHYVCVAANTWKRIALSAF